MLLQLMHELEWKNTMIKEKISKLVDSYNELTPTGKAMVVLCVLLVIGIIIRWDATIEGIQRGFGFFGGK